MNGAKKVAALLLSLDTQTSAAVLSRFNEEEIDVVTREMLSMKSLEHSDIESVQHEFMDLVHHSEDSIPDTRPVTEQLINTAIGEERGREVLGTSGRAPRRRPFEGLTGADARQIADALKSEHPQTIAQIISHIKPQQAGAVLSFLPEEVHSDVVLRMTRLESAPSDLLDRLDRILMGKIQIDPSAGMFTEESRNKMVAEILNGVGKTVRKKTLDELGKEEPEKAKQIESLMFVFEDFQLVDDSSIRKIIMEVDNDTLALALKTASDELKDKFLRNVSKRAAQMLRETLENFGPKPLSEVEAAQYEVMRTARKLDEQGEIVLRRGDEEQLV